jgi:alpha-N-acetylglucosamine transferase
MLKPKNIVLIVLVILSLGIAWKFYKKYKDSDKLKIGSTSLKLKQQITNFNDLVHVLKNGLVLEGFIEIRNFSSKDYALNQLSIDCFSPVNEKLIAEQTNILQNTLVLTKKQTTNIPLEYKIDIVNALALFKECGLIPEEATLINIITHPAQYWSGIDLKKLKVKFKGFIQAEGIHLNTDEEYAIYE